MGLVSSGPAPSAARTWTCSGGDRVAEFRFNHAEVNRLARERWGVAWPIRLERRTRKIDRRTGFFTVAGGRDGRHTAFSTNRGGVRKSWHEIQIVNHPSLQYMLATLAHELEHSRQNEALGISTMSLLYSGFKPARERLGWRSWGPRHRDHAGLEAAAIRAEDRWAELLPCVTQREESK